MRADGRAGVARALLRSARVACGQLRVYTQAGECATAIGDETRRAQAATKVANVRCGRRRRRRRCTDRQPRLQSACARARVFLASLAFTRFGRRCSPAAALET